MRTRRVRLDGDTNTNLRERDNDTLEDLVKPCGGPKSPGTACIGVPDPLQRRKNAHG